MSSDNYPSKSEVMSWNPPRLADYMKRLDLTGCDKVVMKYSMNGPRFLNMSDNDLQKFPKLHAPLITKICREINKKEEKRGFFSKKSTAPKYQEQEFVPDDRGWDSEEFENSDDDYESPDEVESDRDYESPEGEGGNSDNDYEPPPSEPPDDLPRKVCPAKPMGDSDYIDSNRNCSVSVKAAQMNPPVPPQRPGPGLPLPAVTHHNLARPPPPRREQSPQRPFRPPNMPPPGPTAPQVDRSKKPSSLERGIPGLSGVMERETAFPGRKPGGIGDRASTLPQRPSPGEKFPDHQIPKPPLPGPGVNRSTSSAARFPLSSRSGAQDPRNDVQDDAFTTAAHMSKPPQPGGGAGFNSNTFPLHSKGQAFRPGPPGRPLQPDSMRPSIPPGGSLPSRLQAAVSIHRSSSRGQADRLPIHPPQPPRMMPEPDPEDDQDLDPQWYVGQVTRVQAEGLLRQINQDGTFLVRDSSKRSSTQPYTLMVLYQDKVYNLQIRYNSERDIFLLGTGLKNNEPNFPGVNDIIQYHLQMPLLLIDAKDRGSGQQKLCQLIHPVRY